VPSALAWSTYASAERHGTGKNSCIVCLSLATLIQNVERQLSFPDWRQLRLPISRCVNSHHYSFDLFILVTTKNLMRQNRFYCGIKRPVASAGVSVVAVVVTVTGSGLIPNWVIALTVSDKLPLLL